MRLEDFDHGERFQATLLSSERLTPDDSVEVRELILELGSTDFDADAGQSVGVIVPGSQDMGNEHHFRLYTLAESPLRGQSSQVQIRLCVRRCDYIDEYSGEAYRGVASNYLCNLRPGDSLQINGPFGLPFLVPADGRTDLLLISMGTGIAPFRAFVDRLYAEQPQREGRVWLFHGAVSGLELLYMNNERDDFVNYYDRETFQAFKVLSPRPHWADPIAMDYEIEKRAAEIWNMLCADDSCVYLAGQHDMLHNLDRLFGNMAGTEDAWQQRKEELKAVGRWMELLY